MVLGRTVAWRRNSKLLLDASALLLCLNTGFTSPAYAASTDATVTATILPRSDVTEISTDATTEIATRTWAQLLYSGSAGVLTFTIPGSGLATNTDLNGGRHCSCRLTGSVTQIAALVSCKSPLHQGNSSTCRSTVDTEQLAKLMVCTGAEETTDFCKCNITGSVEQIAALLFCNGTLAGSKVVSLMVSRRQDTQTDQSAAIIVAYN